MMPTLHKVDEETDAGAYPAYLRAQSDADLLDILRHLDAARYPARMDAVQRETARRQVLHAPAYTPMEYVVRTSSLMAMAVSAVTLLLVAVLTGTGVSGSPSPPGTLLTDGIPVSRILLLTLLVALRSIVFLSVHLGVYPFLCVVLGWWTLSRAPHLRRHHARADVWRLAACAFSILLFAIAIASRPGSLVPQDLPPAPHWFLTLLDPFA